MPSHTESNIFSVVRNLAALRPKEDEYRVRLNSMISHTKSLRDKLISMQLLEGDGVDESRGSNSCAAEATKIEAANIQ